MNFILVFGLLTSWVNFSKSWNIRERDHFPPDYEDQEQARRNTDQDQEIYTDQVQETYTDQDQKRVYTDPADDAVTEPAATTTTINLRDPLAAAYQQNAYQVIFEKMFIAFGPDFPVNQRVIPSNESLPTVVTPLNITMDPCPEKYAKCSSENFLPSCSYPRNTYPRLWTRRFNLYFDLPDDLLKTDKLLNATLRLYKNEVLPHAEPSPITVEVHKYLQSLTKKRDIHMEINSTKVMSDYIGWVSIDVTEMIRNLKPKKNHGFLIKVKDSEGGLWLKPLLFKPMDCSSDNISVLPLPLGVETKHPEQKFPSLHIRTGRPDIYYSEVNPVSFDSIYGEKKVVPQEKIGEPHKEQPMLNFYEFSRSSKKYKGGKRNGWKNPNLGKESKEREWGILDREKGTLDRDRDRGMTEHGWGTGSQNQRDPVRDWRISGDDREDSDQDLQGREASSGNHEKFNNGWGNSGHNPENTDRDWESSGQDHQNHDHGTETSGNKQGNMKHGVGSSGHDKGAPEYRWGGAEYSQDPWKHSERSQMSMDDPLVEKYQPNYEEDYSHTDPDDDAVTDADINGYDGDVDLYKGSGVKKVKDHRKNAPEDSKKSHKLYAEIIPDTSSHRRENSPKSTQSKSKSGKKKKVKPQTSEPMEGGDVPYSSIEISIHSNSWDKSMWPISDFFEPKRLNNKKRRHRNGQKRHVRHAHHNLHRKNSDSRSKS